MYRFENPNPCHKLNGDCVIRAISISMNRPWEDVYLDVCIQGYSMCNMPSANIVWETYLLEHGYRRINLQTTVFEFSKKYPKGNYILGTGSHVVCVIDGDYYDTWDSGEEIIEKVFAKWTY